MSDTGQYVINFFSALPPLCHLQTLPNSQTLFEGLFTLAPTVDDQLLQLCSTLAGDPVLRASKLDNLRDHSAYLSGIERSLKIDWNETNIENPSILISALCPVWLAGKKLVTIREEIHSIISLFCPHPIVLSTLEMDKFWEQDYTPFDAEIASICTSESSVLSCISKDTLLNWSVKWMNILTEKLHNKTFLLKDNEAFDPLLFIAVKLHYLTGRFITKCKQLHATAAPRALPALKSILKTCFSISGNLRIIQSLIEEKPVSRILQDANPSYIPGAYDVDELRKKAKDFQTLYASLSDDLRPYQNIYLSSRLGNHYREILLIGPDDDFLPKDFDVSLSSILDVWELVLKQDLDLYVIQLDFLSICDKFQNELSLGIEFLCKYECSKYPHIDKMNEQKNSIHNFFFSSHWIDSRQQERTKLMDYVKQINSFVSKDVKLEIFNFKTAMKLVQIINNDFDDFTKLYDTVIEYYDQGIQRWKQFLEEVGDLCCNLSKKSFLLTNGFIKFEDPSNFRNSVKMLRSHSFELENFSEAHTNLLSLGDQLCILCEGGCQEFIQNKLSFLGKLIEEMKVQATLMYNELIPLVSTIIQLKNNINRIEGIISETENNLCHIIQTYSNAKPDVYMNFLIKGKSLLKMYANKLVLGCNLLDSFLGIKALDLTVVLSRYKEAEQKLNKIHCSLSKEMEGVFNSIHDKTLTQLVVGASHLNLYEKFFQSLQDENSSENSSDITKRLHQLEDFFNDKYFADINLSIENLSQCSKDINCVYNSVRKI